MKILKNIMLLSLAFGSLTLSACASSPNAATPPETAGQYLNNAAVTAKVKAILFNTPALSSASISVITTSDTVQLNGGVDSDTQAKIAEQTTAGLIGTRKVENNLVVQAPAH